MSEKERLRMKDLYVTGSIIMYMVIYCVSLLVVLTIFHKLFFYILG